MPKRKKIKESYNNVITEEFEQKYLNRWFQCKTESGLILYSFLIRAEADSLMQIMLSKNVLYSNLYHLTKFEFIETSENVSLKIEDLELLKEIKENDLDRFIIVLDDICKKYSGLLLDRREFLKNPIKTNKIYPEMKMI